MEEEEKQRKRERELFNRDFNNNSLSNNECRTENLTEQYNKSLFSHSCLFTSFVRAGKIPRTANNLSRCVARTRERRKRKAKKNSVGKKAKLKIETGKTICANY